MQNVYNMRPDADPPSDTGDEHGNGPEMMNGKPYDRQVAIAAQLEYLHVADEAKRIHREQNSPPVALPAVKSVDELLAEPDQPSQYRIQELHPLGGNVLLAAQYKAGKTTLVNNLLRALADNTPFLGRFDITTPDCRIALLDDELSENMLRHWISEQGITNTAAIPDVVSLRGKLTAFNPMDDRNRAQWAQRWRDLGINYLGIDCLRPILDAHGLNENNEVGVFLVALDALKAEAGIPDALLVHHMGHSNERSRGDSRLQDWPDAIWRVMRENEQPDSGRFFSAYGRDVDVHEGHLVYDPATRHLTYGSSSRNDIRLDKASLAVIKLLADNTTTAWNKSGIEGALDGNCGQKAVRAAIDKLSAKGILAVTDGPRNSKLLSIKHPCKQCRMPVSAGGESHLSCPDGVEGLDLNV